MIKKRNVYFLDPILSTCDLQERSGAFTAQEFGIQWIGQNLQPIDPFSREPLSIDLVPDTELQARTHSSIETQKEKVPTVSQLTYVPQIEQEQLAALNAGFSPVHSFLPD